MSYIIEQHIKSVHEMQIDLLSDGEIPVPFSDTDWHAMCLHEGGEEPEQLAQYVCQHAAEQVKEYAESAKLYRGAVGTKLGYTQVRIYDHTGKLCADVCYNEDCFQSQVLVLESIYNTFLKVIWI